MPPAKKINRSLTIYLNNNYLYAIYNILIMVFRGSFLNFLFFFYSCPKKRQMQVDGLRTKNQSSNDRTLFQHSQSKCLTILSGRSICSAAFGVDCSFGAESSFGADCSFVTLRLKASRKSIDHVCIGIFAEIA